MGIDKTDWTWGLCLYWVDGCSMKWLTGVFRETAMTRWWRNVLCYGKAAVLSRV